MHTQVELATQSGWRRRLGAAAQAAGTEGTPRWKSKAVFDRRQAALWRSTSQSDPACNRPDLQCRADCDCDGAGAGRAKANAIVRAWVMPCLHILESCTLHY